jgi:hypothetical protein
MSLDFNFIVEKRGGRYLFVAKQYGVVLWAPDPTTGTKELEERVLTIDAQLRDAGISPNATANGQPTHVQRSPRRSYVSFLIKTAIIGVLAIWAVAITANYLDNSTLAYTVRHPAQLIIRMGDTAEKIPPERMDELKTAVRKIAAKVNPLLVELKTTKSE